VEPTGKKRQVPEFLMTLKNIATNIKNSEWNGQNYGNTLSCMKECLISHYSNKSLQKK